MFDMDPHRMVKASPKRSMWTLFPFLEQYIKRSISYTDRSRMPEK